ncbi:MAG: ribosomal L7Ae/L30e/S12e/Gadd45 family protein [Lachnospiraceae bacterium]|nr:ribosomal L7Ae/L30e/S12e/Gadd45 family protein [Lachnospiraceae bacterium]
MQDRLYNALGLCMKAGKVQSGAFACEKAIRSGKAKLVLLEDTASDSAKEQYRSLCDYYHTPFYVVDTVGEAIGKPGRIVMAVTDEAFQKMMEGLIAQESTCGGI